MIVHRATALRLHEANHGSIALRVKLIVIIRCNLSQILGSGLNGIAFDILFDRIPVVRQQPSFFIDVDLECLIVEGHPFGWVALDGSCHILIQIYFPDIRLVKVKVIILIQNLKFVWQLMRAHLRAFIEVHVLNLGTDMEVPGSLRLTEAAHRLIRF